MHFDNKVIMLSEYVLFILFNGNRVEEYVKEDTAEIASKQ